MSQAPSGTTAHKELASKAAKGAGNTAGATTLAAGIAWIGHDGFGIDASPEQWVVLAGAVTLIWNLVVNFWEPIISALQRAIIRRLDPPSHLPK